MVVGNTCNGKTVMINTLKQALNYMNIDKIPNILPVNSYYVNPKAISLNNLFGYVNLLTNEWSDGVISHIVGSLLDGTKDKKNEKEWLVFDGPADPTWVENLNTVLDENKMLCLSNG